MRDAKLAAGAKRELVLGQRAILASGQGVVVGRNFEGSPSPTSYELILQTGGERRGGIRGARGTKTSIFRCPKNGAGTETVGGKVRNRYRR